MHIALTGGIGSGKSCVASILANAMMYQVVSADTICRNLLDPGGKAWLAVREKWQQRFFNPDDTINRPLLREAVFKEEDLRHALEDILHPLVRDNVMEQMLNADKAGEGLIVEVPLLFEVGWQGDFDCSVAVYASTGQCLQRIAHRDGVSLDQARRIMAAQMEPQKKARMADYIINNSGLWVQTVEQVARLARLIRRGSIEVGAGSKYEM